MTRRAVLAALVLTFGLFAFAPLAQAQETTLGFYLVPKIGTGAFNDPYRPKYIADFVPPVIYSAMDYGEEGTFLVGAQLTAAQHQAVTANSDVIAIPPLDTAVGGNPTLNRVRNYLEGQSIPGDWVQATTTWRGVLGRVGRTCLIMQRLFGIGRKVFGNSGNSLNTTLGNANLLDAFIAAGSSLGLSTGALDSAMTIRQALLYLADQLPLFTLAGETF